MADWLTLHRLDPAYRAHFADGSTHRRAAPTVDAMADQIDARLRRRPTPPAPPLRRLAERALPSRSSTSSSTATSTRSPTSASRRSPGWPRWAASAASARKVASFLPDERLQRLFSFQAMYAGARARPGARALRGDHLPRQRRRACTSRPAACTRCPRALPRPRPSTASQFRYGVDARPASKSPAAGRVAVHTDDGERLAGRRRRRQRRPARRPTRELLDARRPHRAAGCGTRRRASLVHLGHRRRRRPAPPRDQLRDGLGAARSPRSSRTGG